MGSFSIGGLATGLDTKAIVDQLIQVEARPRTKMEWSKSLWEARRSTWGDLNTRLRSLGDFAQQLITPGTWLGAQGITSSNPAQVSGSANSPTPTAGSYSLDVTQLAANEVWSASNALAPGVGGVRQSGSWYDAAFSTATGSTPLTSLTDADGTSLGLTVGSQITLSASVNGSPVTATHTVTGGDTLDSLAQWAEGQFAGSNFTVNAADGTITYNSAPGASNEITALSFTATSGGSALPVFNGTAGASSSFVSAASGGTAAQTLTITQGASTWNIAISNGDDTTAIVNKINGTAGIGVNASIVSGKLQIASTVNGAAGDFGVSSTGSLVTDLGLAETTAGRDATFTVDGTAYTRDKNLDISDVITGVDLDLLAVTGGSPVTLQVQAGGTATADSVKKKIMDFVKQYNEVIDFVNSKTGEAKVTKPKNLSEYLQGPVSRDYRFGSIGFQLRNHLGDDVNGLPAGFAMLADIGITSGTVSAVGALGNTSGRLVVDEAKLDAALASDMSKVRDIFATGGAGALSDTDGIGRRVSKLVSQWRVGGAVDSAMQGASSQVREIQENMDRFNERLERKRVYYERMFSGLESRIGRIQSQMGWLSGQFAALSS